MVAIFSPFISPTYADVPVFLSFSHYHLNVVLSFLFLPLFLSCYCSNCIFYTKIICMFSLLFIRLSLLLLHLPPPFYPLHPIPVTHTPNPRLSPSSLSLSGLDLFVTDLFFPPITCYRNNEASATQWKNCIERRDSLSYTVKPKHRLSTAMSMVSLPATFSLVRAFYGSEHLVMTL